MPSTTINFSFANITTGRITFTPKQSFSNDSGAILVGGKALTPVLITNGIAAITVPATQSLGIAYTIRIEEGTSPNFTLVDQFDRIVSNTSPVQGKDLLDSYFSTDLLDTSVLAIGELLTKSPYLERLTNVVGKFDVRIWNANDFYTKGQIAARGSKWFRWISNTSEQGKDPLIAANTSLWETILDAPAGAGTTTNVLAWNAATFAGRTTEPASRDNLASAIAGVAAPDLSNYAQRNQAQTWTGKQTFGAGASGVTAAAGTNNTDLATNAFVQAALGTSSAIAQQLLVRGNRFNLGSLSMGSGDSVIVDYGNFTANVDGWHSGTSFRVPSGRDGDYEFEVGLDLGFNTATLNAAFRVVMREFTGTNPDQNFTDVILILAGQPYNTGELGGVFRFSYPCTGGRNYAIRATALAVSGSGARTVRSSSYNRLSIWRR